MLSPKRSHARFMTSLLSRSEPKALSSRSTLRLFIGSSAKRKWSFFLFWALNPRSQGTMPTGMIHVSKSEQLDNPREEGRWRKASQFPRLDAWIICHLVIGSILHHEGDMTIYREKVSPFFGPLNNSAQDYSDSSFRQLMWLKVNPLLMAYVKATRKPSPSISVAQFCPVSTTSRTNFVWVTILIITTQEHPNSFLELWALIARKNA